MNTLYLIRPICFPRPSLFVFLGSLAFIALPHISAAEEVIDIGSRRQLFLEDHLIGELKGVRQELHSPVRRNIAIKPEHPWEKHGVSYMIAFRDQGKFRAWYRVDASALDQEKRHSMTAYAESDDGIHWTKKGAMMLRDDKRDYENIAVAGPVVQQTKEGGFRMWYSAIGTRWGYYSICYAESPDGLHWTRGQKHGDNLQLAPQGSGWEKQMVEYPSVIREGNHLRLFYCGNGYGRTGIGTAVSTPR